MNVLRRLTVLALVAVFAAPAGAASAGHKLGAPATSSSSADAAAVQSALLAVRERLDALRERRQSTSSNIHKAASSHVEAARERVRLQETQLFAAQRAEIDMLRAKLSALNSTAAPKRRVTASPRTRRVAMGLPANTAAPAMTRTPQDIPSDGSLQESKDVIALPTLERLVEQAPEMRVALSGSRYSSAKLASLRSQTAPEFTLSTSAGAYRELVTDTLVRNYTAADLRLGIRVPLFGGFAQEGTVAELGDELTAKQFDVDEARLSVLRELRGRYVDYWTSARKLRVTKAYLNSEAEVETAVALRVRAGLSLAGTGLQAVAGYNVAKENTAHFARDGSAALTEMRRLTDSQLPEFRPVEPALAAGCETHDRFIRATLAASPGLALLRDQLDGSRRLAAHSLSTLRGAMIVSQGVVAQQGAPTTGRSTAVGLDLALPVDSGGAAAAQRQVYTARADEIGARLKYETEHLRAQADDAWNGIREGEVMLQVAQSRVGTSRELASEGLLRYGSLTGETVENLQSSRLGYYRSLLDAIDAEAQLAKRRIVAMGPADGCSAGPTVQRDLPAAPNERPAASVPTFRVYAWNSRALLDGDWTRAAFWDRFASLDIRRLMLSLDGGQIGEAQSREFRTRLQRFIAAGASAGVDVDLLLGEPHWILPDQRNGLLAIVRALNDVPFHTLALDIEPTQLSAETRLSTRDLQRDLVETIQAVAAVSPWPVSLSANYHDFLSKRSPGDTCYACALQSSGVKEIVLMTYVADPDRVADLVRPILRSHQSVSFAIAQSVESVLPSRESYRAHTRPEFVDSMSRLTRLLDGEPNFTGIAVQSYVDYTAMQP